MSNHRSNRKIWACTVVAVGLLGLVYVCVPEAGQLFMRSTNAHVRIRTQKTENLSHWSGTHHAHDDTSGRLPGAFYENHVYSERDFSNEQGVVPTFWEKNASCWEGQCQSTWGPCFPPKDIHTHWDKEFLTRRNNTHLDYHKILRNTAYPPNADLDLSDYCRPGFLIIGQGKCGTSSLYHYLVGHPRVLPASEKQIHYFRYYPNNKFMWYLSHFPTATDFLSKGALMTGEASPGYLPYPDVVTKTARKLEGVKVICVGRDPLDRSYSSYRYNYVNPALAEMKRGRARHIPKGLTDEEYIDQYLYSFEDMMKAELENLKKCLAAGGPGETGAKHEFGSKHSWVGEYKRRQDEGLPPMVDLDKQCYGDFVSPEVPRKQWENLVSEKPGKFLNVPNMHLSQAMIGRSLYVYPLEWWYGAFPADDIYFLCTEEMKDMSGNPINNLGQFLGLPSYNFSSVVSQGMYNVGGHKGYDKVTSWDTAEEEKEEKMVESNVTENERDETPIPISDAMRRELLDFFKPHNERLFKLVGRRCNWET